MANVSINDYKLMRARNGRMLGGVAAGLARASGLDVTLVRLCIGATMLFGGLGVPAYILMWIILPEESPKRGRVIQPAPEGTARAIRITLVVLGVLSVLNKVGGFWPFANPHTSGIGGDGIVGLALLAIGATVLLSRHRPDRGLWANDEDVETTSRPRRERPVEEDYALADDEEPPTYTGPFGEIIGTVGDAVSGALREARTTAREARPSRPTPPSRGVSFKFDSSNSDTDTDTDLDDYEYDYDSVATEPQRVATVTSSGLDHSGGAALGWARVMGWFCVIWWTLSAIAVTGLWLLGAISIHSPVFLVVASWLVLSAVTNTLTHARFARAIIPSLALLLIPVAIGAASIHPEGGIGYYVSHPTLVKNATLTHDQAVGRLDFDLAKTTFSQDNTTINGRTGAGAIFVTVPNDVAVTVHAKSRAGAYEVFGHQSHGASHDATLTSKGCEGKQKLTLNLRTGAGYIQVHRANGSSRATCNAG